MWSLLFASLSVVLGSSLALQEGSICIKAGAKSCDDCIQVSSSCGWCSDENFLKVGESKSSRCDDLESLKKRNCDLRKIENPRGSITVTKNEPFTEHKGDVAEQGKIIQIQPQKISLALRPGEPQEFSVRFKQVEVFPVDLYYLMDLSSTRGESLENMKKLATDLMTEMHGITSDFRIGFGFIKPHISTTLGGLNTPCTGNQNCTSYMNVLKLTNNWDEFRRLSSQQQASGNPDSGKLLTGGLDAIMQVAMCEEQIGWRNTTRLLVFSTDDGSHLSGIGTPGSCVPSNDWQCHLEGHTDTTKTHHGRPCIADLVQKLREKNIQIVFVVPEELQPAYKQLKNAIPKSAVGTLSSNSSSVANLITDINNVVLENGRLPEGISITYKSICKDGVAVTNQNDRKCSNISIGEEVSFQVSVESQNCWFQQRPVVVPIRPMGFTAEVELLLSSACNCQCAKDREANSPKCYQGNGTFECGDCKCNDGRIGPVCECDIDEVRTEDIYASCRKDETLDLCSNNGDCVCGYCECKKRENPSERYSGRYCECDNFNCDRSNNKLCGGHGTCECRRCICDNNYTGSACDCSLDTSTCLATNGQICNGRGICECGICKCTDPKFQGSTCEICPTCPGLCLRNRDCVLCRAFGVGEKKDSCEQDCSYFELTKVKDLSELPQPFDQSFPVTHCKERGPDDSWLYFTYNTRDGTNEVHVVQTLARPR